MKDATNKILAWIAVAGFLSLSVLYVFEFHYFGNTIQFGRLMAGSLIAGLLAGIVLGWKFGQSGVELVDRVRVWTACLLLPVFFAPLLGSLTNRLLSPYPVEYRNFEFYEERPYASSAYGFLQGESVKPSGYYVFVISDGEILRFKRASAGFEHRESGDTIQLPVRKGLWGIEWVAWKD